jgi:hypothetical protein
LLFSFGACYWAAYKVIFAIIITQVVQESQEFLCHAVEKVVLVQNAPTCLQKWCIVV